ncbi:MAG: imelysin family protein, partial [Rhodospirillaceae bacterium]
MTKIIAQRTLIGGALLALVGMTSPASVQADPSADLTPALNEGIAQIGPMLQGEYGSFAETAAHLSDAVGALACGADPEEVRPAFRAAFTAWARVQSVHIGPINSLDRRPRI